MLQILYCLLLLFHSCTRTVTEMLSLKFSRYLPVPLLLFVIFALECFSAYRGVLLCQLDAIVSSAVVSASQSVNVKDSILVLSDLHIDSFCPFGDIGMWLRRIAAEHVHSTRNLIMLGDINNFGGGASGAYNISDFMFNLQIARFKRIIGCSHTDMVGSRCVIVPGNHDLVDEPTARWLTSLSAPNSYGVFDSGVSYYILNSQSPKIQSCANASLLLSHSPVLNNIGGPSLFEDNNGFADQFSCSSFGLVLSGDEHLFSLLPHTENDPAEIIVPSFSALRAYLAAENEGCHGRPKCQLGMGFGILKVMTNGSIYFKLCHPVSQTYFLHACLTMLVLWYAKLQNNFKFTVLYLVSMLILLYVLLYFAI
jgi:hypothetical protein